MKKRTSLTPQTTATLWLPSLKLAILPTKGGKDASDLNYMPDDLPAG